MEFDKKNKEESKLVNSINIVLTPLTCITNSTASIAIPTPTVAFISRQA